MKTKVKLSWKVLNYDFNRKKIYAMECLGEGFSQDIAKRIRSKGTKYSSYDSIKSEKELRAYLEFILKYKYWSKSEMEMAAGGLFCKDVNELEKIDAWYQLEMNFDRIVEYIIKEMEIDFKGEK